MIFFLFMEFFGKCWFMWHKSEGSRNLLQMQWEEEVRSREENEHIRWITWLAGKSIRPSWNASSSLSVAQRLKFIHQPTVWQQIARVTKQATLSQFSDLLLSLFNYITIVLCQLLTVRSVWHTVCWCHGTLWQHVRSKSVYKCFIL